MPTIPSAQQHVERLFQTNYENSPNNVHIDQMLHFEMRQNILQILQVLWAPTHSQFHQPHLFVTLRIQIGVLEFRVVLGRTRYYERSVAISLTECRLDTIYSYFTDLLRVTLQQLVEALKQDLIELGCQTLGVGYSQGEQINPSVRPMNATGMLQNARRERRQAEALVQRRFQEEMIEGVWNSADAARTDMLAEQAQIRTEARAQRVLTEEVLERARLVPSVNAPNYLFAGRTIESHPAQSSDQAPTDSRTSQSTPPAQSHS